MKQTGFTKFFKKTESKKNIEVTVEHSTKSQRTLATKPQTPNIPSYMQSTKSTKRKLGESVEEVGKVSTSRQNFKNTIKKVTKTHKP